MTQAGYQAYNAKFPLGLPLQACGDGPSQVNGIALYSTFKNFILLIVIELLHIVFNSCKSLLNIDLTALGLSSVRISS